MIDGVLKHEGSLDHGTSLSAYETQFQIAGKDGFSHNEVNPDAQPNRMLQIWMRPMVNNMAATYDVVPAVPDEIVTLYDPHKYYAQVGDDGVIARACRFTRDKTFDMTGAFMAYLGEGNAEIDDQSISAGCMIKGEDATIKLSGAGFIVLFEPV